MRRPVIAGNWKMFKTQAETRAFIEKLRPLVANSHHCDIVVAPPFTSLHAAVEAARGSLISSLPPKTPTGKKKARTLAKSPCPCSSKLAATA